jgi:hypothetical protein
MFQARAGRLHERRKAEAFQPASAPGTRPEQVVPVSLPVPAAAKVEPNPTQLPERLLAQLAVVEIQLEVAFRAAVPGVPHPSPCGSRSSEASA